MGGLADFRAQNPAYNDMDDAALADALHRKFYADMPREQFDKKVGYVDPVSAIDMSGMDPTTAKAAIDKLPEGARARARDKWADAIVAKERAGGGAGQTASDYMYRFGKAVPGVGPWIDEAAAGIKSLFGSDYEMAHAYERAVERAIKGTPTPKLGTLPVIGDVTAGGLTSAAGTVAGALATPMVPIVGGVGMGATALNVGANAALASAADAAGDAPAGARGEAALRGGATGLAVGAPLGAVIGGIAGRAAPRATDAIAEDAARVGVDLPRAAATSTEAMDSARSRLAGGISEVPFVGSPLVRASRNAMEQMDQAATRIAGEYAGGPTTAAKAGEAVEESIGDWISRRSARELSGKYEAIDKAIDPKKTFRLPDTTEAVKKLTQIDYDSASSVFKSAIDDVREAISRPEGLTFAGLRQLRTNIGAQLGDSLRPNAGTSEPALKMLYGALSRDLVIAASSAGKGRKVNLTRDWNDANAAASEIIRRRERLERVIGKGASRSPESVAEAIIDMAGTTRSGHINLLREVRKAVDDDAWKEIAGAAVHRLGRNQANEWSPSQFFKRYSALSDDGRRMLFGAAETPNLYGELESLARVAEKYKALEKFGNPSGTGRVNTILASLGAGAAAIMEPMTLLATAFPVGAANMLARSFAKPVQVRQISQSLSDIYDSIRSGGDVPRALNAFVQVVADQTKEDPAAVQQRLERSLRGR
jgi:hypothetical protein